MPWLLYGSIRGRVFLGLRVHNYTRLLGLALHNKFCREYQSSLTKLLVTHSVLSVSASFGFVALQGSFIVLQHIATDGILSYRVLGFITPELYSGTHNIVLLTILAPSSSQLRCQCTLWKCNKRHLPGAPLMQEP